MQRLEEREQARLVRWSTLPAARTIAPELEALFHVPNGGKRDAFTGAQMKALGVKPGIPDLLLPCPESGWNGLAIEMKYGDGKLSAAQDRWIGLLLDFNWSVHVCYSAEEARSVIADYLRRPTLREVAL